MKYVAIRSEGGLIPYDLLEKIANEDAPGQRTADFGLGKGRRLSDEIQRTWSDALDLWDIFSRRKESLTEKDPHGTTLTRERWIVPLLTDPQILGYDLKFKPAGVELNGLNFPVSHWAGEGDGATPVHIEGFKVDLDRKSAKLRTSPRAMVQEFLNHSEANLWGIVTNGLSFRLLRDSAKTARPTYLEFDLQTILEGNHFNEFALFYRLCHRTRLPKPGEDPAECWLEKYYQQAVEQGGRVREKLRDGVEDTLKVLGSGFLRHPANEALRQKFASGRLPAQEYHRQLLRLVYRLLFLMVAEERRMIVSTGENAEHHQRIYRDYYSVSRLRERAEGIVEASPFSDLWLGLKQTFLLFSGSRDTNPLGIPPLNGDLFGDHATTDLNDTQLHNHELLIAIRRLSMFEERGVWQKVNYSALDVEELGSVYESLLDFRPVIEKQDSGLVFDLRVGSERKTTGSYYTRPELVRELIQSALVPVMEDRLNEAGKLPIGTHPDDKRGVLEKAILGITVCDPACGSGHFLLEAARRLGRELARIRTGEDEPSPEQFHLGVRDAVSHCIYGVDLNPLAVDLCKLALWLEGHWTGKPLSFLDHRIKCGNSLIGVLDPSVLEKGIPDEAFNPVTGDDKKVASAYKKRNKKERETLLRRFDFESGEHLPSFGKSGSEAMDFPEDKPEDVHRKEELYRRAREQKNWLHDWTAANLWTAAFFVPLTKYDDPLVPTHEIFMDYFLHGKDRPQMTGFANALFFERHYFHWQLEFPEVFGKGGFDVVLGNPPWEMVQLDPQEFFALSAPAIASAPNMAARDRMIAKLATENPSLLSDYQRAKHTTDAMQKFIHESGHFPFTSFGRLNLMALFAELSRGILNPLGRSGILVPTGIATDAFNQHFFNDLVKKRNLASLYDFENREGLFPAVDSRMKFCLLTMSRRAVEQATFAFFCTNTSHLRDEQRRFWLTPSDLALLNPNTRTCPIFRTRVDAELTKKIYRAVAVLVDEERQSNPWRFRGLLMFMMNTASDLFKTSREFPTTGPGNDFLPLYEGKMIQAYDHRAASVVVNSHNIDRQAQPEATRLDQYIDPHYRPSPRYWVHVKHVEERLPDWPHKWLIGVKDVTSATNERTAIFTALPRIGVGHKIPLLLIAPENPQLVTCFLANLNSLPLDYVARNKVGGNSMGYFILKQLPVLAPDRYSSVDLQFVLMRVVELVYTAWDMKSFAGEMGYSGEPFPWNADRRAQLRAELDAYYMHLYGLTRDEVRYILDPKDVFGEDYPSETFRALKGKEEKEYGEYRTRRLVLAAYDQLAKTDRFAGEKRESAIEAPKGRSMVPVNGNG